MLKDTLRNTRDFQTIKSPKPISSKHHPAPTFNLTNLNLQLSYYADAFLAHLDMMFPLKQEKGKFLFCLWVHFQVPITQAMLQKFFPKVNNSIYKEIIHNCSKPRAKGFMDEMWQNMLKYSLVLTGEKYQLRTLQQYLQSTKLEIVERITKRSIVLTSSKQKKAIDDFLAMIVRYIYIKQNQ